MGVRATGQRRDWVRNDEGASELAGCAGWAGGQERPWLGCGRPRGGCCAGCKLLLHFYFFKTEIETEKLREKGEELELKENILQLLELSTILINCIGHF